MGTAARSSGAIGAVYPATNEVFHDETIFRAELRRLFHDSWVFAGTLDMLPGTDTWFVYEDFERSVIVTRDRQGRIGAFVNSCRHRGARLCEKAGAGKIKCPYHGWVYDCDGRLLGATRRKGLPDFDPNDLGLQTLRADTVGPFIFIGPGDANAASLTDFLGPVAEELQRLGETMFGFFAEIRMTIRANWKLAVTGGIEDYHVPFVHGGTLGKAEPEPATSLLQMNGHSSFRVPFKAAPLLRALVQHAVGGDLVDEQHNQLVFPNLLAVRTWTIFSTHQMIPLGVNRTLRVSRLYDTFPLRSAFTPAGLLQRVARRQGLKVAAAVYGEDRDICEVASEGTLAGRTLPRGPAHVDEARVEHFLREVARALGVRYVSYGANAASHLDLTGDPPV